MIPYAQNKSIPAVHMTNGMINVKTTHNPLSNCCEKTNQNDKSTDRNNASLGKLRIKRKTKKLKLHR